MAYFSYSYQADRLGSLKKLLNSGDFADSCVVAGDGHQFRTHRAILCRVPFFQGAFNSGWKEQDEALVHLTEDRKIVRVILDYLYDPGSIINRSPTYFKATTLLDLCDASDKYVLGQLFRWARGALHLKLTYIRRRCFTEQSSAGSMVQTMT